MKRHVCTGALLAGLIGLSTALADDGPILPGLEELRAHPPAVQTTPPPRATASRETRHHVADAAANVPSTPPRKFSAQPNRSETQNDRAPLRGNRPGNSAERQDVAFDQRDLRPAPRFGKDERRETSGAQRESPSRQSDARRTPTARNSDRDDLARDRQKLEALRKKPPATNLARPEPRLETPPRKGNQSGQARAAQQPGAGRGR